MKRIVLIFMACLSLSSVAFAQESQKQSKKKSKATVEFVVTNEEICHNCVRKINDNIAFEKGVTGLKVDQATNRVKVTYRADKTTPAQLKAAFSKIKMEVEEVKTKDNDSIKN